MSTIDWVIIAFYAIIVIAIGIFSGNKQNKTKDQQKDTEESYIKGLGLPWWAIGFSIIATSFSAASLLGGPGEGYTHGFLYLQLQFGDLIGYGLVIVLFLPFFIALNLTTAYQYLEDRFDAKTRSLGALCFLLFVIARLGGLLYAASLVVSTVTEMPLNLAILIVGIVSIVYTVAGGMTAVVWTDVLQFAMIFVGLAVGIGTAVSGVPGGWGELWQVAAEGGKLEVVNLSWEPESIRSLPTALFAYGILAFAVAGTNQQSVQRYVSCKNESNRSDIKLARKAILLGWFSGFLGVAATLLLGVLLFSFYSLNSGLPDNIKPDEILSYFIVNQVPPGASGLLVAAIFAAAMSSIDSALHSLATCITVDFYERYFQRKFNQSQSPKSQQKLEAESVKFAQILIVVWGIFAIFSAFYVASIGESLLPFLIKYSAMFLGPLLGIFLMGVLFPRINATGAFYGTIVAVAILAIGTEFGWFTFPGIWRSAIAAPLTVILGLVISQLGQKPTEQSLQGLTLWHQKEL
ncbi:MAG TPA: sodium-coupled permease [Cyanothece sp. UBA12306]|nr:sodium-coupled permease [Cyanothece sp. UBA12306]